MRALVSEWTLDGPLGIAFIALVTGTGATYLLATAVGTRRDRRGRRWPRGRSICFLSGLAVLVVDLCSGIGSAADSRLAVHMVEHMIMWLIVAPLLAAGAPVRLALFALPRNGRKIIAGCLHSRIAQALTRPVGSVSLFSAVLLVSHVPAVYDLALANDYVHQAEHAAYLLAALLMWAPILGVDPLPHRPTPRGQLACMAACMMPMAAIGVWLAVAPVAVYGHYATTLGTAALRDQRLAAAIMLTSGLPAFAVPALSRARLLTRDGTRGGRRRVRLSTTAH